jgi:SAM-dependent methyltransferase
MSVTTDTATARSDAELEEQIGAYTGRLFETGLAALEAFTISLGRQLHLYDHLTTARGLTAGELAQRAGIDARYAREWLEQQAAAGWIDVTRPSKDAEQRRFGLSPAAQECLLRPDSLASTGPLLDLMPSVTRVFPGALIDAFRTGTGIAYADYALHDAQGDFNRPAFLNLLATDWLPRIPGLVDRLRNPGARVAEIGCGEGWAAIGLAQAFDGLHVDGFDLDEASIAAARRHAREAGVADRVKFEVADVTRTLPGEGTYDLVLAFEMIHDLARPVEALATMRRLGKSDAVRLVMDEKVAEDFEPATGNPVERLMYAASVLHCLPVGRSESPSAATGTVMRPCVFTGYAARAGFSRVEAAPIDHDLFRFYQLIV